LEARRWISIRLVGDPDENFVFDQAGRKDREEYSQKANEQKGERT
jgi:hypothetical protein